MKPVDQREKAYEAEFAHQQEVGFRVREHAIRQLALWAAQRLGKAAKAAEDYAHGILARDVTAPETTLAHVERDLLTVGVGAAEIRRQMERLLAEAEASIRGGS